MTGTKNSGDLSWVPVTSANSFIPGNRAGKMKVCPLPAGASIAEKARWWNLTTSPGSNTNSPSASGSDMPSSLSHATSTPPSVLTNGYSPVHSSQQVGVKEEVKQTTVKKPSLDPRLTKDTKFFLFALNQVLQDTVKDTVGVAFQWAKAKEAEKEPKYTYADYKGVRKGALPKHAAGLPQREAFTPEKVGVLAKRAYEYALAQMPFVARLFSKKDPSVKTEDYMWTGLRDKYRSVFESPNFLDEPEFIKGKDFDELKDGFLANQFISGCNPVVIEHVTDDSRFSRIPEELREHQVKGLPSPRELFESKRLFIVDYKLLRADGVRENLDKNSGAYTRTYKVKGEVKMTKYFYAPIALLYRDEKDNNLQIYSIKLSHQKTDVYSRTSCHNKPKTYLFAKMHLACADNQHHQFATHLFGHLVWEPFSVAYQNVFNLNPKHKNHVVGNLLSRHFEGAIAINWLARQTLVASDPDPLTDGPFAVGGDGAVGIAKEAYRNWTFDGALFPRMLEARGFDPQNNKRDKLKGYYFRDDGFKVWKALKAYVQTVIDKGYDKDEDVWNDDVLKEWCDELIEKAKVKGFPSRFEYKSKLVDAITTIIFHVSAVHAACNFSQIDFLSYVPNRPNALFKPVPSLNDPDDITMDYIFKLWNHGGPSEPLAYMHFQVQFAYILSTPAEKTLMNMGSDFAEAYEKLKSDLHQIHMDIQERKDRGETSYAYLDPYKIPPAIDT